MLTVYFINVFQIVIIWFGGIISGFLLKLKKIINNDLNMQF